MTTVLFSHGQESGPWGTKIRAMADMVRELGCEADSIDYQGLADPSARVDRLVTACRADRHAAFEVGKARRYRSGIDCDDETYVNGRNRQQAGQERQYAY